MTEGPQESGVWKAATLILAGIVISLLGCIYTQDQNRATKGDLSAINDSVQATQKQVQDINTHMNFLEGQLRAKKMIEAP